MNSGDPANPTFIKVQPSNVQFRARIAPITWGRSGGISHSKASGFPTRLVLAKVEPCGTSTAGPLRSQRSNTKPSRTPCSPASSVIRITASRYTLSPGCTLPPSHKPTVSVWQPIRRLYLFGRRNAGSGEIRNQGRNYPLSDAVLNTPHPAVWCRGPLSAFGWGFLAEATVILIKNG